MGRTPKLSDFPQHLRDSILTTPPSAGSPRSLLILLHGLGDDAHPFSTLGRQLNLPSTATLSLRAPNPVPAPFVGEERQGGSWHWGDDILISSQTGCLDLEGGGFGASSKVVGQVLKAVLLPENGRDKDGVERPATPRSEEGCGFEARDVFFLGFGQGGMVALAFAELWKGELGGVVAIGSALHSSKTSMSKAGEILGDLVPSAESAGKAGKAKTPVLACGGNRGTAVTATVVREAKERFETVTYVKWAREGDGMPRNREEMFPLMKFLAQRLRMATPGGMEELGGVQRA